MFENHQNPDKWPVVERTMAEKNGESTPRYIVASPPLPYRMIWAGTSVVSQPTKLTPAASVVRPLIGDIYQLSSNWWFGARWFVGVLEWFRIYPLQQPGLRIQIQTNLNHQLKVT